MKLTVIFIGTGSYLNFLPKWYEACEQYLVPSIKKQYCVFTDGEMSDVPDNVAFFHQDHMPWPYITLLRFKTILNAKDVLLNSDWVLFLDADTLVVDEIKEKDLFTDKKYIGVHHPCHFMQMDPHNKPPGAFETNLKSNACITEDDDTSIYFQGCLWGGRVPDVIEMIEELDNRTQDDLSREVIAVWHDESQMNKFFAQRRNDVHVLGPSFAYPEVFSEYCDFEPTIIHLAKDNSKYQQ